MPWDDLPPEILHEFASESQELLERLSRDLIELESAPSDELVSSIFRSFHTVKGSAGFLGFSVVESQAHEGESLLAEVRAGRVPVSSDLVSTLLGCVDQLSAAVTSAVATAKAAADPSAVPPGIPRAPAGQALDIDAVLSGESQADRAPHDKPGTQAIPAVDTPTVRVRLDALDGLLAASGELVIARNRLRAEAALRDDALGQSLPMLDRAVRDVQAQAVRARLQPLSVLLSKLPRTVRDTARELGKSARVELHGASTEVDRSLIDALRDPLVHLVRNAVDHGLEDTEVRVSHGKPEVGTISVTAWQASGCAHISVADDGAGISWERIRARATELGLLSALDNPSQDQLGEILLSPGFSTASSVSRISGRGVGLDVVNRALTDVGGSVSVTSVPGSGTTVTMSVPLSLLVMPALLVRDGPQVLALDQHFVEEVVALRRESLERVAGLPVVLVRGEPVFVSPVSELGAQVPADGPLPEGKFAVVVATPSGMLGVLVDDVLGVEDLTVRPLDPMLRLEGGFSGAALLEDGSVVFVVDSGLLGFSAEVEVGGRQGGDPSSGERAAEYFLKATLDSQEVAFAAADIARLESLAATDVPGPRTTGSVSYREGVLPLLNWSSGQQSGSRAEIVVMRLPDGGLVGVVTDFCEDVIAAHRAQDLSGSLLPNTVVPVQGEGRPLRLISAAQVQEAFRA